MGKGHRTLGDTSHKEWGPERGGEEEDTYGVVCACVRGQAPESVPSGLRGKALGKHRVNMTPKRPQRGLQGSLVQNTPSCFLCAQAPGPVPHPDYPQVSSDSCTDLPGVWSLSICLGYSEEHGQETEMLGNIRLPTDYFCRSSPNQRTLNPSHNIRPSPP